MVPRAFDSILAQNLPDGKLLAIAGAYSNRLWNLAKVDLSGNLTTFYQFPSSDLPNTALYGADGNYYGTACGLEDGGLKELEIWALRASTLKELECWARLNLPN
jgi:hypothetical protein